MGDEHPSKVTIVNGIYKGDPGCYTSKENVLMGTVRVIDGELYVVRLKHSHPTESVWYKFYTKKELEKMEKRTK